MPEHPADATRLWHGAHGMVKERGKIMVMVVEDEVIISMTIQTSLRALGFEVSSAVTSGEEAVKCAQEDRPDLILMDIKLKGEMSGIEAARRIQGKHKVPIIFLSAYSKEMVGALSCGFLPKPFQEYELAEAIEELLPC